MSTIVVSAQLDAQVPAFGLLTTEEGGPIQRISMTPMTERAAPTEKGAWSADMWLAYSNIFEQDSSEAHELFLDTERLLSTLTVRYGAGTGVELGGRLTFETTGGGVLDSFITWWHDKLHLGNANRERYPIDAYDQHLEGPGEVVLLDIGQRTLALEDVRLFVKWQAASNADGSSLLSLRAVTRIPTNQNLIGRERTDFALLALGQLSFETWYLHGMLGGSTVRSSPELEAVTRSAAGFFTLGAERAFTPSVSGVVQISIATPVLRGFNDREIDQAATNFVFGVTGRWRDVWRWDVSFQEDIPSDTPAIDFTLGARISRSW